MPFFALFPFLVASEYFFLYSVFFFFKKFSIVGEYLLHLFAGMRIRFWPKKTDPGLCTSNEGRILEVYKMNILDNFKRFFFCFHTFGVRRTVDVLDPEKQPGSGSIDF